MEYLNIVLTAFVIFLTFVTFKLVKKYKRNRVLQTLNTDERKQLELIRRGDLQQLKAFYDTVPLNPDFRDPINKSSLLMMCAPDDNKVEIARLLIEKGCDYNAIDKKGMDMLFVTTYWNCKGLFDLMIQQKNLQLDRSNTGLRFEMNPLSACIYKSGDLAKHIAKMQERIGATEADLDKNPFLIQAGNKYFAKAVRLLSKGANPTICRQIIERNPGNYDRKAYEQFEPLLDFFERWHSSKKVLLMDYYLAKEGRTKTPLETKKRSFALEKMPPMVISRIADKYL